MASSAPPPGSAIRRLQVKLDATPIKELDRKFNVTTLRPKLYSSLLDLRLPVSFGKVVKSWAAHSIVSNEK